jgi:hypothetical protein
MNLKFEHDFQQKIMVQSFEGPTTLNTAADVNKWRSLWMQELKSWHSPYRVIVDASQLTVSDAADVQEAIQRMLKFYEGLFLKSIIAYSPADPAPPLPFEIVTTFEEAQTKAGVRGMRSPTAPADFRATIQFQNHFAQHVVELSFSDDVLVNTKEQIVTLKSKLTNNLMQWHSKWSLLVDCSRVEFDPAVKEEWEKVQKFLSGFFLKACVGYGPKGAQDSYPFTVYRARHKAVAQLEAEGMFMGNDAHCRSTKTEK